MTGMAVADRYSRLVLWLKVALPLAALIILSTLFFVAETLDPEAAIPYAEVDVERILKEQGVNHPTFGGVTPDGTAISMTADKIRPDEAREQLTGDNLNAALNLSDGSRINIESTTGIVDSRTQEAVLAGGARLESSSGVVVVTERIATSLKETRVTAEGTITATGPAGTITAGQMELTRANSAEGYLLVFKSGVRLVYQP